MTIANGENAASGGITGKIYKKFCKMVSMLRWITIRGTYKDIFEFIDDAKKMVRPANFPEDVPGQGMVFVKVNQLELAVINLQARTFMVHWKILSRKPPRVSSYRSQTDTAHFVDFHGETTSEKQAMSWF